MRAVGAVVSRLIVVRPLDHQFVVLVANEADDGVLTNSSSVEINKCSLVLWAAPLVACCTIFLTSKRFDKSVESDRSNSEPDCQNDWVKSRAGNEPKSLDPSDEESDKGY